MSAILKRSSRDFEQIIEGETFYKNRRYRTVVDGNMVYIHGMALPIVTFNEYFSFEHELIRHKIESILFNGGRGLISKTSFNKNYADVHTYGKGLNKRFAVYVGGKSSQIQIRLSSDITTKTKALSKAYTFIKEISEGDYSSVNSLEQVRWGNCGMPLTFSEIRLE